MLPFTSVKRSTNLWELAWIANVTCQKGWCKRLECRPTCTDCTKFPLRSRSKIERDSPVGAVCRGHNLRRHSGRRARAHQDHAPGQPGLWLRRHSPTVVEDGCGDGARGRR